MNIGRATEYTNTSQLFIGVNFLKMGRGRSIECRMHSNDRGTEGANGSGVLGGGIHLSSVSGVWSPRKKSDFVLRNVELLCILDSGARR